MTTVSAPRRVSDAAASPVRHGGAGIRAIGRYIPERVVGNAELESRFETTARWIRDHIGIETRHVSGADEWTSDLGAAALLDACDQAAVPVTSVDLVICGTYTPDQMLPSTAMAIMRKCGLTLTPGFDLNSGGCSGSVYALTVGARLVESGQYRRVAVVLSDVNTKAHDPRDRTVGVIFGDAAACYLLEPVAPGQGIGASLLRGEPFQHHAAHTVRERRYGDDGSEVRSGFGDNFVVMNGREIRRFVLDTVPKFMTELADSGGTPLDTVDFFALHQANRHLVHEVLDLLGQPRSKTLTNVERLGNTSGASVPLVLREALDTGRLRPGSSVLAAAFGSGLSYGAVLLRWCGPEDFATESARA